MNAWLIYWVVAGVISAIWARIDFGDGTMGDWLMFFCIGGFLLPVRCLFETVDFFRRMGLD